MKKILFVLLLFIITFSTVACDKATTTATTTTNSTVLTTTSSVSTSQTSINLNMTTDEITLSYADWGNAEINQILIDAFMEKYPNITVELRTDITGSGSAFTANLINAMVADVLPDVFAIDNIPTGYYNGMLLDIKDYWDNDPETDAVYENIASTGAFDGARYGMPSFQFIKGIYINISLFEAYNIPLPDKDWTYTEFIALARQIRQIGQNDYVYGIEPWYGKLDFETTFPMQDDATVGYNTWDGTQFNFTSQAWVDAYNLKLDLMQEHVVADYTEEELEVIGDIWPWYEGLVGMKIDGSWNLWMIDDMYEANGIEVGFWPYPGGSAGQFPPTILDYLVVSSQTDYPLEAYELAKWMSFGKESWLLRLDRMKENGDLYLDRYPISDYPEVWEKIDYFEDYIEGLRENLDLIEYGRPDTDKWLPGYKSFWEWVTNEDNDYYTRIDAGLVTPSVFAADWEEQINKMIVEALNQDE
ncbi:MAG: extracellular solute-binding protein [Tenericutes bacterium]|nr:extracellular solute-binding protein [Mycoplasmatota bacterium]